MAHIIRANTDHHFEHVHGLIRLMALWDAKESEAYGVPAKIVLGFVYQDTAESLKTEFGGGNVMLLATVGEKAAGCIGFSTDADGIAEIHKFFVHPDSRGSGLGTVLLRQALAMIDSGQAERTRLHTAVFMQGAINLYRAHGFQPCAAYREVPPEFASMDVFLERHRSVM